MQAPPSTISARMLAIGYERLRTSVLISVGVSALFALLLTPYVRAATLLPWLAVLQGVALARYALWVWYQRTPVAQRDPRRWSPPFFVLSAAAGASWSSGLAFGLAEAGFTAMLLALVTVIAVSAVASSSLSAHFAACAAFILAALAPIGLWIVTSSQGVERVIGFAAIGAAMALLLTAWGSWSATRRMIAGEIELEAALAQAAEARRAAERANAAKSAFLATMSHEIRTPLNGVLGLAMLLDAEALPRVQRERVEMLRRSGQTLLEIVNDILDFSKIEAEQLHLVRRPFDVRALVGEIAGLWADRARASGLDFAVDVAVDVPQRLEGDPLRLRQVLGNLISNAVKFTEAGAITVAVDRVPDASAPATASTEAAGAALLRFSVRDTGIGIDADDLTTVFDAFTQVDDSGTRRAGGTGLGLAICRRLVELMNGHIDVQSERGTGSTFSFVVPLEVLPAPAASPLASAPADGAQAQQMLLEQPRALVLVVEDNAINRMVAGAMLERLGYEHEFAEDGVVAIEAARSGRFDLILMDCQMPRLDGYQATAELRRLGALAPRGRPIPIIALTANTFDEDRRRAADAGMDGFLAKPLQLATLRDALAPWLERRAVIDLAAAPPGEARTNAA